RRGRWLRRGGPRSPPRSSGAVGPGQGEMERGAPVRDALRPHAPAVSLHDTLHQRQTHARTLEFLGSMQAAEYLEQLVGVSHVEPDPVVLDEVYHFPPLGAGADADVGTRPPAAELDGV